jgi:teichuronic acid biosynthesis glycosyltransferase TuaH
MAVTPLVERGGRGPAQPDSRSYVIYGSMSWNGQWNVEHNIAHALAGRHRVLYVDPPLTPATPFRYGVNAASRRQLVDLFDRRVRPHGRLNVFTPVALPPLTHPRMRRASVPLLRSQIGRAVAKAGLEAPVVVAWHLLSQFAGAAGESLRVAVVMDHLPSGAGLAERDAGELEAEIHALCAASDLLCVPSHPVQELMAQDGFSSRLLPFAFAGDLAGDYDGATEPEEYRSLPRPLLGYTGSVDDRLNYELVVQLADQFRDGSIVFVGPLSPRLSAAAHAALASRPNIHLLGMRPRSALPAYVRYLDCAMLPYAEMLFTQYQSPMKVWDYLYAGPPIVGTGSPELKRFPPPLVEFAERAEDVPALVREALAAGSAGAEERRAYALANTWDSRAEQLDAYVDDALTDRRASLQRAA